MKLLRLSASAALAAGFLWAGLSPASAGWIVSENGSTYKPLPSDIQQINKGKTKMTFGAYAHGGKEYVTYSVVWDDDCGTWRDARTKREVFVFPVDSISDQVEDVYHTTVKFDGTRYRVRWEACGEKEVRAPAIKLGISLGSDLSFGRHRDDDDDHGDSGPGFSINIGGD
jgi:hypothetical protein